MTIMKWRTNPGLADIFDSLFDRQAEGMEKRSYACMPAVNIIETPKGFELEVGAAGFAKEDYKIGIEGNILTISSEVKPQEGTDREYLRREFYYGSFSRSFALPKSIDTEKVAADYQNGILRVMLPKREELTLTREIKVQ